MGEIMERVLEFFDREGWGYELGPEGHVLDSGFRTDSGEFGLRILALDEPATVVLVAAVVDWTPEERRGAVCEFLVRVNWAMNFGSFQMDLADGEVHLRVVLDLEDGALSAAMVRNLVGRACHAVEFAYPGLMAVTWDGLSPAEAAGEAAFGRMQPTAAIQ